MARGAARHRAGARRRGDRARRDRSAAPVPGDRVPHRHGQRRRPVTPYFFDLLHLDGDRPARRARPRAARRRSTRLVPEDHRVPRLVTSDPSTPPRSFFDQALADGSRGRRRQAPRRAVRRRPARLRLGQGQAGAHPRPGRARRRVGQRPARGLALQHPPRRPRPGDRRLRDARQDLQGDDRRDARLADRAVHRAGPLPRHDPRRLRRPAPAGAGRRDRLRRRPALDRATPAAWRCGSPGCCATATTRPPTRPTRSTRSASSSAGTDPAGQP